MTPRSPGVIVPCAGGGHRVRLAGGRRFWSSARCPVCRAAVDPLRWRRVAAWWTDLGRTVPGSPPRTWLARASLAYLVVVVGAAVVLWALADRAWPATVLLFGPRWVLGLPLAVLVPAALLVDRRSLVPLGLAAVVVAGPLVGLRTGWRAWAAPDPRPGDLRVVTFNARGGAGLRLEAEEMLSDWNTQVAAFQECAGRLRAGLEALEGWHTDARSSLCLASRFPILGVSELDRDAFESAGGSGLVVTWTLDTPRGPVHVTNVHLETPRVGLELIRRGEVRAGIARLREKSFLREVELARARRWAGDFEGPHVVVGDFNTPVESRVYRLAWGDWTNAFDHAGRGLGGTRLNGWIRARIDHVLADRSWRVLAAGTLPDAGSDHLPLRAVLAPR